MEREPFEVQDSSTSKRQDPLEVKLEIDAPPLGLRDCLQYSYTDTTQGLTWQLALGGLVLPVLFGIYLALGLNPNCLGLPNCHADKRGGHIGWDHHQSYVWGAVFWFGFVVLLSIYGKLPPFEWETRLGNILAGCGDSFRQTRLGRCLVAGRGTISRCFPSLFALFETDPDMKLGGLLSIFSLVALWLDEWEFDQFGWPMLVIAGVVLGLKVVGRFSFRRAQRNWVGYDAVLVPSFFILVAPMVPAVWILGRYWLFIEQTLPNIYRDLFVRIVVVGIFGPISITCYWTMRRPDHKNMDENHIAPGGRVTVQVKDGVEGEIEELTSIYIESKEGEVKQESGSEWRVPQTGRPWLLNACSSLFYRSRYIYIFAHLKGATHGTLSQCRVWAGRSGLTWMVLDSCLEALFAYFVIRFGATQFSSADNPCQSPVQDETNPLVPCINVVDWWKGNFSYMSNDTMPISLNSTDQLGRRYPEAVDIGLRFQSISLGVMLIVCACACHGCWKCYRGFQALAEAVDAFLWQFPSPSSRARRWNAQEEFLKHMIRVRAVLQDAERLELLGEYHLDQLPLVPSREAVDELREWMEERGESSGRTPLAAAQQHGQRDPHQVISWEWWFRYHAASEETVIWYYWRLWWVLIGLLGAWILFVCDIFVTAGLQNYKTAVTKETSSILYATLFFGLPVLAAVVMGSFLNTAMADCLETVEGVVRSVEDKQCLDWAKRHPVRLRLCFWDMDFKMVLTAVASIFSGVLFLYSS